MGREQHMGLRGSRVTLYGLPGCYFTRRVRDWLTQHHVPFREVNLLTHPKVLAGLMLGLRRMLPLVSVDDHLLEGWPPQQLAACLRRAQKINGKQRHFPDPTPPQPDHRGTADRPTGEAALPPATPAPVPRAVPGALRADL
ncbi:MAG: hypothetical protein HS113_10885 [Verrucomicrobiales bacterium]|nr:hypothetical protein [Verrucomicrobiales bacterium]